MKNWLLAVGLFLTVYSFFLVKTLPMSVVLGFVSLPNKLLLSEVSGTVWQAKFGNVQYDKVQLSNVTIDISAWSLLTLNPEVDVQFGDQLSVGPEGKLTLTDLLSQLKVTDAELFVAADQIAQQLPLPIPLSASGQVTVMLESFMLGEPICSQVQGKIQWPNSGVKAFNQTIVLGDFSADLACEEGVLALTLAPENNLGLTFSAYVRPTGVSGTGYLLLGTGFPSQLTSALPFLGKPDRQGRYRLSF